MTDLYLLDKSTLARVTLQPAVQAALEHLDDIGVLATTAVVDLEIGYSANNLAEFDSVATDRADLYQELPLTRAVTDRARKVQREPSGQAPVSGIALRSEGRAPRPCGWPPTRICVESGRS